MAAGWGTAAESDLEAEAWVAAAGVGWGNWHRSAASFCRLLAAVQARKHCAFSTLSKNRTYRPAAAR